MKIKFKEETKEKTISFILTGCFLIAFYFLIQNVDPIKVFLKNLLNILMPFILGFFFAFLLGGVVDIIENKLLLKKNWKPSFKRKVSVCLSLILLFIFLGIFGFVLVNQVIVSIQSFLSTMTVSMDASTNYLNQVINRLHLPEEIFDWIISTGQTALLTGIDLVSERVPAILSYSWFVVTQFFNMFVAIIVATYILLDKEKFYANTKRLCFAFLPESKVDWLIELTHISSRMFNSFIVGKMIDSLIIGVLCYVGMSLLGLQFAVLISFIVGVTNMIPIFGPFIGAVPGFIILLITSPQSCITFVIWIIALQQFDGNILGPKILGNSMGLPTIWIMFAIMVGGAYFGFVGMFLGVPVFSVFYYLLKEEVARKLKEKELEIS